MNPYGGYGGYAEPVVPPRRKRSLSTSRTDPVADDTYGFSNRMRRNFSTDHIPNDYMYGSGPRPMGNYYMGPQQQQQHRPQYRQPYSSSGNLYSPMQPPGLRMANPVPMHGPFGQVPNNKVPVRPHQDYLKYAQGANMAYNPYNEGFNPTLMARPTIEPFQSMAIPNSIANAIARGRDRPLYSSKEHLPSDSMSQADYRYGGKPERPPPPSRYGAGLSTENLSHGEFDMDNNSRQFRDRRSVSPSRLTPADQRPYNIRRSTSPLPSALSGSRSPEPMSLSRSGSRSSMNAGYQNPHRLSREPSPLRSPSPMRGASHFSYAPNLFSAHEYQPLTRTASTTNYTSRSSLLGNSSPTWTSNSFISGLTSRTGASSTSNVSGRYEAASATLANGSQSKDTSPAAATSRTTDRLLNVTHSKPSPSSLANSPMDNLQVPNGLDETSFDGTGNNRATGANGNINATPRQLDRQFSESFTDHCDQYKSVTSKILGKKANRKSGDFSDFNLSPEPERNRSFSPERSVERDDYLDNGDMDEAFLGNGPTGFEQSAFEQTAFPNSPPNSHPNGHLFEDSFSQLPQSLQEHSGQQAQQSQQPQQLQHQLLSSLWNEPSLEASSSLVARTNDTLQAVAPVALRRSSSSNGLSGQQRKGSLPSDYSLKNNSIALSNDWSREKVADMAHAARQRLQNPSSGSTVKKIGTWFTRQFVFLLIAGLNILLAYVFYNLLAMLPIDETARKY